MITVHLPGTKPKTPVYPTYQNSPVSVSYPTPTGESLAYKFAERDRIVKELFRKCPYWVGHKVIPETEAGQKKYGTDIVVTGVCSSYAHMGKDEAWPTNDNPMIVSAYSNDKKMHFFCTIDFLKKAAE